MDENKYKNWVFTWNANEEGLLYKPDILESFLKSECSSYIFQFELGEQTNRAHIQGAFVCFNRIRHKTLLNKFREGFKEDRVKYLTLSRMAGSWEDNVKYCSKSSTAVAGSLVQSKDLQKYEGREIAFLSDPKQRYSWQEDVMDALLDPSETRIKDSDDRSIIWISDTKGNSGKSKLVKYLCFSFSDMCKVSFGTAGQLRSSVISAGPKLVYFVDIPRTLGEDDSIPALISCLEDIKNGYVVSSMYGKHTQLMMAPPHVVIFSNQPCPVAMMSRDRWVVFTIADDKTMIHNNLYARKDI